MQTFVNEYVDEWGPLAAGSVLIIVPAAVVFFLVERHLVSGLTAGAAKSRPPVPHPRPTRNPSRM